MTGAVPRREPLWTPSAQTVDAATITRYSRWLAQVRGIPTTDYEALWRWSVSDLDAFWRSIVDYFELRFETGSDEVLRNPAMPGAEWFPGSRLSYAEHIFRGKADEKLAIQHASELRTLDAWTWGRLRDETARIVAGLRRLGVGPGDRVAAYMPNIPETVAAFLACASIGAVWSAAAPEFGALSVIDRFKQIAPKVLLAVDGYRYGGKEFDRTDIVDEIARELPGDPPVVRFGYLDGGGWPGGFLRSSEPAAELRFTALPFDHPLWVLYTSGTTGLPKPIVHGQGGMLLEQVKSGHLHLDARVDDRVFWYSTTGWMVWNLLVGVLLTDASIILFDGSPGYPNVGRLWDFAEETGMTCFGTSAAFISSCMKAGVDPREGRSLSKLRAVGSTGSPLSPEGFRWVYDAVGKDTWLFSTSGGTDVCTAFVGGVATLPVYEGEIQARCLGASVEAWDSDGNAAIDEVGELVITRPMPSMPVFFWGDSDGSAYRDAYFSTFAGVWRHGDWIAVNRRGGTVIYGRSDSTINRGGVRIGTSEIYRAVLASDEILDALVVDRPFRGADAWMSLFVVLRDGVELTAELQSQIRSRMRDYCSPRHIPDEIIRIGEIPRTLSGKVTEVPVKRILMGVPLERAVSRDTLANPQALDFFVHLRDGTPA